MKLLASCNKAGATVHHALKIFETEARKRLGAAVLGQPEDAIRAPAEALLRGLAAVLGGDAFTVVPETPDPGLAVRPDMAILRGALIGYVELKAPGKGADPRRFPKGHDRHQWEKLKALPNLIYLDGEEISLWRSGELAHGILRFGDLSKGGLTMPSGLDALLTDFLAWSPIPPRTVAELAQQTARLCRLLRDEVAEQLAARTASIVALRNDWRDALAPGATDPEFADGYAQAVTFGLLMARARGIALHRKGDLRSDLLNVGHDLRASDTLIGAALEFMGTDPTSLRTSLGTLMRVLDAVNWPKISKGNSEAWLYFYEPFLKAYNPTLHRQTGTYYTPAEVVREMVRLADDALREPGLFDLAGGLAHPDVTLADPATGTGTFLLAVLRRIRDNVETDQGAGAVPGAIRAAAKRLIGFELQFGPFVVAQLRLLAELLELTTPAGHAPAAAVPAPRVYLADTLRDPHEARTALPSLFAPITASYAEANAIKSAEPITVIIGNPPYKEKAEGRGGWIEQGRFRKDIGAQEVGPLSDWAPDAADGAHAKHLKNLYVYFWRWAAWKAWGDGAGEGARCGRRGVVSFITVAGFLNGPGFKRMRAELRREADAIWVIDGSPDGHQPPVHTRIFQGVQQPVCIVMVARKGQDASGTDAHVRFRRLPVGPRADKFAALAGVALDDAGWTEVTGSAGDPFLPAAAGDWERCAPLGGMFYWDGSGVMPGRTWVIAPDRESLAARWNALRAMIDPQKQAEAFYPHMREGKPGDKHIDKPVKKPLAGQPSRPQPVRGDGGLVPKPLRYAMRSFDRQWIIPDARLINQPNPTLWERHSKRQVYLTALTRTSPRSGPAITFTALIPDLDHYHGRGGRIFPLWRDAAGSIPNIRPALLARLKDALGTPVSAEDHLAWIAGIAAHPAFTARFQTDLIRPGLRVPLTADPTLWAEGVRLGRRVIWLHTYGQRFTDPADGRPAGAPRLPGGPTIPAAGAIPGDPADFPDERRYEAPQRRLHVGKGYVDAVAPEVAGYEVSGKTIITQWFSYRRARRARPLIGDKRPPSPLDAIRPDGWPADYTADLIDLLHVLTRLVALGPAQADLLDRVMAALLIEVEDVLETSPAGSGKPNSGKGADDRQQEMEV